MMWRSRVLACALALLVTVQIAAAQESRPLDVLPTPKMGEVLRVEREGPAASEGRAAR